MMMILRMYLVNVQLRLSPACINPKQLTEKLTGTSSSSPGGSSGTPISKTWQGPSSRNTWNAKTDNGWNDPLGSGLIPSTTKVSSSASGHTSSKPSGHTTSLLKTHTTSSTYNFTF